MQWTGKLFDEVAAKTNLGPKTIKACRRVLVPAVAENGVASVETSAEVARTSGLYPSQISRAVSCLRRKVHELNDLSLPGDFDQVQKMMAQAVVSDRSVIIQQARRSNPDLVIKEAEPLQLYVGKPLVKSSQHLIQSVGSGVAVIHDLAQLQRSPNMNAPILEVQYPANGGLAFVAEKMPEQVRGGRGGR